MERETICRRRDDEREEILEAGADFAGITEVTERIQKGWFGFDRCLATPDIMPQVLKVARILGPKKLLPNPKSGTVVTNLRQAILEAKSGAQVEFRAEGEGVINVRVARVPKLAHQEVLENVKFFVKEVLKQKPKSMSDSGGGTQQSLMPQAPWGFPQKEKG